MKPALLLLPLVTFSACNPEALSHCDSTVTEWCSTAATASCDWASASNPAALCGSPAGTSLGQCGTTLALKEPGVDVTTITYFDSSSGRLTAVTNTATSGGAITCLAGRGPSFTAPPCNWTQATTNCPDGGP